MYVLVEGEIGLSVRGRFVETLTVGSKFGEMALLGKEQRTTQEKPIWSAFFRIL